MLSNELKESLTNINSFLVNIFNRVALKRVINDNQKKYGSKNADDQNCCVIDSYAYGTNPPSTVFKDSGGNPTGIEGQIYFYINLDDPGNNGSN